MRTKTILLSALLGTLSSLPAMSQVYSANVVGYVTVTLNPGFTIITDQLLAAPVAGYKQNALGVVLPADFNNSTTDGNLVYLFSNPGGYAIYTIDSLNSPGNGYDFDPATQHDPATNAQLLPGQAAFYFDSIGNGTVSYTFVGTVPQGTNNVALNLGFNLVGCPAPLAGQISTDLGFPVDFNNSTTDGDLAYVFTPGSGYSIYTVDTLDDSDGWYLHSQGDNLQPTVAVGEGFFYFAGQINTNWAEVFEVTQ